MTLLRRVSELPPGNVGVLLTVQRMREHIRYQPDPEPIRRKAAEILAMMPAGFRSSAYWRARAVYEWVQSRLAYTEDTIPDPSDEVFGPLGLMEERLRNPKYILWLIEHHAEPPADCDDYVIVMVALWLALALQARLVLTSAQLDREYDHVFAEVLTERGWIAADAIRGESFGWDVRRAFPEAVTASLTVPV